MSEFNITVEGGKSVRLPTAGKYCDRDIVVTATGSEPVIEPLEVTENGTYTAPDGVDGYSPVMVEVEAYNVVDPNWTSWDSLFYEGVRTESVEKLKFTDSHNVVNFANAFYKCTNLTTIPPLDTSNGITFVKMFQLCENLTTVPELDLSSGTDFNGMFSACKSLTTLHKLDTSKGTNFTNFLQGCSSLTTIREIDLSSGTSFNFIFSGCSELVEIGFKGAFKVKSNDTSFLKNSPNVNQESLHKLIDCMVKTGTASTYTIGIGSSNLARVSAEYVQKALDKGIKLQ